MDIQPLCTGAPAEVPKLAAGTKLLGPYLDSGFRDERFIVRRADGQMVLLSALLYFVAANLDGSCTTSDIAQAAGHTFNRPLDSDNIVYVIEAKLRPMGLVEEGPAARPAPKAAPVLGMTARFTLLPARTVRSLAWFFSPTFAPLFVLAALAALVAFDAWLFAVRGTSSAFAQVLTEPLAILGLFALLLASMVFHEVGHAAGCYRGGGRPGDIGAGFYLMFPAFYTNVTDAYRLGRAGRLRADLGGIYFNGLSILAVAPLVVATGSPLLIVAVVTTHLQVVQQLLPVVRFDGYYILSDLVGVPDLFARIRPILAGVARPSRRAGQAGDLRRGVRLVVVAWMAVVVPALVASTAVLVVRLPELVGRSVDQVGAQLGLVGAAVEQRAPLTAALAVVAAVLVALPLLGLGMFGFRLAGRVVARGRALRRPAPPVVVATSSHRGTAPVGEPALDLSAACFTEAAMLRGRKVAPAGRRGRRARAGRATRSPRGAAGSSRRAARSSRRAGLERQQVLARVNAPLDGSRRIAIVCRKGGCGKTTTTLMLGHTFAAHRRDRVVALDANPDAGSLGHRVRDDGARTVTELLEDRPSLTRFAQLGRYTMATSTRLDVVASDNDPAITERLGEHDYHLAIDLLDRFYNLILADTGTGVIDAAVRGVLAEVDQLVVVVPPALDGARVAAATLDWLDQHGYAHLVGTAVAAINAVEGTPALDLGQVEEHFGRRCSAVVRIPWDPALGAGAATRLDELEPATQAAYRRLAAAVADQFSTSTNPEVRS